MPGYCQGALDHTIDWFSHVPVEEDCQALCRRQPPCANYTYFGEGSATR